MKKIYKYLTGSALLSFIFCAVLYTSFMLYSFKSDKLPSLEQAAGKKNLVPVVIIGGGPAGLTAALYTARAKFYTALVTGEKPGGQLAQVHQIENWPGKEKSTGAQAINELIAQVKKFGAVFLDENAKSVQLDSWPFAIQLDNDQTIHALSLIIATGRLPKKLNVPGVETYWSRGVGACTLCDAPFHKGQSVAVVGGGDTAADYALQLAAYAQKVYMFVRDSKLDASATVQEYLKNNKNIEILFNTQLKEIRGDGDQINEALIENNTNRETIAIPLKGLYFAIGYHPNSSLVKKSLSTNKEGFISLQGRTQMTSIAGVFAAGDVTDDRYGKTATALGSGAQAGMDAIEFLQNIGFNPETAQELEPSFFKPATTNNKKNEIILLKTIQDAEQFIHGNHIAALEFFTDYCPTCKTITKHLEKMDINSDISIAQVNTEAASEIAKKFSVTSVPYMVIFKNGAKIAEKKIANIQDVHQLLQESLKE